jgi:group I intron endonuclease
LTKGIYKIENIFEGKVYIGESSNIEERWIKHKEDLNNNCHHSWKLQKDWNEYDDETNFKFEIIEEIDSNLKSIIQQFLLFIYEDKYIKKYDSINNGYNIQDTLDLILKGDKSAFAKHKMTYRTLGILKGLINNVEKNNGIYVPSGKPNIKKSIVSKEDQLKFILNLDNMKFIIDRCKNYKFEQEYKKLSEVLKDNGLNINEVYKILRNINIFDEQNKCLIEDISLCKCHKGYVRDKETNEITREYYTTYITRKGFKYFLHKILTECKNNNVNVFMQKFIIEVKNNINKNNNINIC